ncbi:hypothetical protein ES708_16705 [subsurface metagenome]
MKRTLFVIAGIILIMLAVVAFPSCRSYQAPPASSSLSLFVPQRADLVVKIEIEQILNDADFAYLYQRFSAVDPGMPRTVDQALDQVTDETGIDLRDFRQVVAFANTSEVAQFMESPYPGGPYWGALLKGSFAEKRMMLAIAGLFDRDFENYRYKGAKIYYYTEGREVLLSFTFVSNDLIVVGSTRAVEDTIDVMAGDYEPISGIVYNLYESLPQAYFKAAFSVPPSITREIPSGQEIDQDLHLNLRPLRDVNIVGFTFGKIGSTTTTEVELHCTHIDSAQEIEELVRDLLGLGRLVAPDPRLKHHLDNVEVTSYGSVFSLRITETIADIEDLIEMLTEL